jgi:hypothetical protein
MSTHDFDVFMQDVDLLAEFISEECGTIFDHEEMLEDFIDYYPRISMDYAWMLYDALLEQEGATGI